MTEQKMHADEISTNLPLVRRLLLSQYPQWAELALQLVPSAGTDNAMYRLGPDLAVRLPRIEWAVADVSKEYTWLPRLAPHLPLPIPAPLALGQPSEDYPWPWAVYRWLDGEDATLDNIRDEHQLARDLAEFVTALHGVDTAIPASVTTPTSSRGVPLAERDEGTREAINACADLLDAGWMLPVWEAAVKLPPWDAPPVWIHGDLKPGNLLAKAGRLSAVIDFGGLALGDPAVDLIVAWNLLSCESRAAFRAAMNTDDAMWLRGRAWALSVAVAALPYYQHTNPILARISRYQLRQIQGEMLQEG